MPEQVKPDQTQVKKPDNQNENENEKLTSVQKLEQEKAQLAEEKAQIELVKVQKERAAVKAELAQLGINGEKAVQKYDADNSNDAETKPDPFKYIAKSVQKSYKGRKEQMPKWEDIPVGE